MRRYIGHLLVTGLLMLFSATKIRGDAVEARLILDGKDATDLFDAKVGFFRFEGAGSSGHLSPTPSLICQPGTVCQVPTGTYSVDVKSPFLVAETRPSLVSEGVSRERTFRFNVYVVRAASLRVSLGRLPSGARVDAIDEISGTIYQRVLGPDPNVVTVPARAVVVGVFAPDGRLMGILRTKLAPGAEDALPELPSLPRGRGQLFVGVRFMPSATTSEGGRDAKATIETQSRALPADVVIRTSSRVDSFWLDVPSGSARVGITSKSWSPLKPLVVDIPDRGAAAYSGVPLIPNPTITLTFGLPDGFSRGEADIALLQCDRAEGFHGPFPVHLCTDVSSQRGPIDEPFTFRNLRPGLYAVKWALPPLFDVIPCDIRDGKNLSRRVPIRLYMISGTVKSATKGIAARLRWSPDNAGGSVEALANDDGEFEVRLTRPGGYTVLIDAIGFPRMERRVTITRDERFELEIPGAILIRVVDEADRTPIAGARVSIEEYGPDSARLERTASLITTENGTVSCPSTAGGRLSVAAEADGYLMSARQQALISDRSPQPITIVLKKGNGIAFHIASASGHPAEGAVLVPEGGLAAVSDERGIAAVKEKLPKGHPIVVFDRNGTLKTLRFNGGADQSIEMPAAGPPLIIRFSSTDARPLRGWNAIYSLDGVVFPGFSEQVYRAGGDLNARADGTLRIMGLPSSGTLSIWPFGRPDLVITRLLPVTEELVFTLPGEP